MKKRSGAGLLLLKTALSGVLAGGAMMGPMQAAHAQEESRRSFSIAAQPLGAALMAFSRQTGIELFVDDAMVQGKTSSAVNGSFTPSEALSRLLTGTGLTYRFNGNGTVTLERAPQGASGGEGGAITLGPVRVQGEGPGRGTGAGRERPPADTRGTYTVRATNSATGLDLSIQETPQVVNVITRQRIEDQNLATIGDVLAQAPGVTIQQQGVLGAGRVEYWARGFPITNVMLDGVSTTGAANRDFDLWSILDTAIYDRVELVQGATGLRTGAGDPSASVNFVRKRPTEDFLAEARASYGTWDRLRGEVDLSGPVFADGAVRARLVGAYQQGGTWQDRVDHRMATLYGVVEADVTDRLMLTGGLLWTNIRVDDAVPFGAQTGLTAPADLGGDPDEVIDPFALLPRSFNPATRWTFTEIDLLNPFAKLEWRFADDWRLNANYMYSRIAHERIYGAFGLNFYYPSAGIASLTSGHVDLDGEIHNVDASVSGRFHLFGRAHDVVAGFTGYWGKARNPIYFPGIFFDYLTGTYFDPQAIHIDRWNDGDLPFPTLGMPDLPFDDAMHVPYGYIRLRESQTAGYFGTRLRITDRLSAVFGGRVNRWTRSSSDNEIVDFAAFVPPYTLSYVPFVEADYDYTIQGKFTPYAGLLFDVTPNLTVYGSFARIEKANVDWESGQWVFDRNSEPLPPLRVDTYELGVKAALFDGRLNIQLAAYRMRQTNNPILDPDPDAPACIRNPLTYDQICNGAHVAGNGGIVSRGVDFSLSGQVAPRFNLSASYSYLKVTYRNSTLDLERYPWLEGQESVSYCLHDNTNAAFARGVGGAGFNCPRHMIKAFGTWQATDKLTIGGGFTWKSATNGDQYGGIDNLSPEDAARVAEIGRLRSQGAYAIVDLMARYRITPRVTLAVNVNNLFDETYRVAIDGTSPFGGTFYGAPRNVMVSLGVRY